MPPTIEEIREVIPGLDEEDKVELSDEKTIKEMGLKESIVIEFGDWCAKIYRSAKNLVLVVLMVISVLEGSLIVIPPPETKNILIEEIKNVSEWENNIETKEYNLPEPRYFSFLIPATPSPEENIFQQNKQFTALAPISGSNISGQQQVYQNWYPNSGVA